MKLEEIAYMFGTTIVSGIEKLLICKGKPAWKVDFKDGFFETKTEKHDSFLRGVCGIGSTETEARKCLADELQGKVLVKNATGSDRLDIQLPTTITWRK